MCYYKKYCVFHIKKVKTGMQNHEFEPLLRANDLHFGAKIR